MFQAQAVFADIATTKIFETAKKVKKYKSTEFKKDYEERIYKTITEDTQSKIDVLFQTIGDQVKKTVNIKKLPKPKSMGNIVLTLTAPKAPTKKAQEREA